MKKRVGSFVVIQVRNLASVCLQRTVAAWPAGRGSPLNGCGRLEATGTAKMSTGTATPCPSGLRKICSQAGWRPATTSRASKVHGVGLCHR